MQPNEMLNIIYDTLMKNTSNPKFDTDLVEDQFISYDIDNYQPRIFFTYEGQEFSLLLKKINKTTDNK